MQTNRKTTANEATRMSGRISEIRDINVIKLIPWRHRLLYLLDVISWLLEAVQFLIVPATHCTRVSDSDPRQEQLPLRKKKKEEEEKRYPEQRWQVFPGCASAVSKYRQAASNHVSCATPTDRREAGMDASQSPRPMGAFASVREKRAQPRVGGKPHKLAVFIAICSTQWKARRVSVISISFYKKKSHLKHRCKNTQAVFKMAKGAHLESAQLYTHINSINKQEQSLDLIEWDSSFFFFF